MVIDGKKYVAQQIKMGSISNGATVFKKIKVLDSLDVDSATNFSSGVTTNLVYSDPATDLDIVRGEDTLGTSGAIRLKEGTVELFADNAVPVATVKPGVFEADTVENSINGKQGTGAFLAYYTTKLDVWDGSEAAPNATFTGNLLACPTVAGMNLPATGPSNTLTLQADESFNFPLASNAGIKIEPATISLSDGTNSGVQLSLTGQRMISQHTTYAYIQLQGAGTIPKNVSDYAVFGLDDSVARLNRIAVRTSQTANFTFDGAEIDGIQVTDTFGLYEIGCGGLANLATQVQLELNGTTVIWQSPNSVNPAHGYVIRSLNNTDIVRVKFVGDTFIREGFYFYVKRLTGTYEVKQDGTDFFNA